jgi:hypothetical protein
MASTQSITVTPAAFSSLGQGPLLVEALNAPILIAISDSQPSAGSSGLVILPGGLKEIKVQANIWASTQAPSASLVYAPSASF